MMYDINTTLMIYCHLALKFLQQFSRISLIVQWKILNCSIT